MKPFGQVNLSHVLTGIVTAVLLGGGSVVWDLIKPAPKESEARAVDYALLKQDVALLKSDVATLKAQGTRIESTLIRIETSKR